MAKRKELLERASELGIAGRSRMRVNVLREKIAIAEAQGDSLERLKATLAESKQRADFVDGTVIRWSMKYDNSDINYTYAAVKAGNAWYTTSAAGSIPRVCMFKRLLGILESEAASDVEVAVAWESVG